MNVFDAQGIRKTYGETRAVDGVDRRCQWVVAMSSLNASVGVR